MNNCRYFIYFCFNGTKYNGWQKQKNAISIQEILENHLSLLFNEHINLVGAGRTDTGVHASFFTAHFNTSKINIIEKDKTIFRINNFLPPDIAVFDIKQVKPDANSRFDAIKRTYKYHISGTKEPFKNDFFYIISPEKYNKINVDLFNEGCKTISKEEDFSSFSKTGTKTKTNNCLIFEAYGLKQNWHFTFTVTANRFLRNMVRALTGTLLDVAWGKTSIHELEQIIKNKKRSGAGESVPAKGLFLTDIIYPEDIFIKSED